MKKYKKLVMVGVLALCAACDKSALPPLGFGASPWPGYEPVYLAQDLGYFQGENLHLESYPTSVETEAAFRAQKIHLAAMTLEQALLLRRDMPDLKVVLLLDEVPGKRLDVLVTRDEYIGQYHQEMGKLFRGWRKAVDDVQKHPEKTAALMAKREGVTEAQFSDRREGMELYDMRRNQHEMMGEPPPVGKVIDALQRKLLSQGRLRMGLDASMMLDSTILAESGK